MSFSDATEPDPERYRHFSKPPTRVRPRGVRDRDVAGKVGVPVVNRQVTDRGEGRGGYLPCDQRQLFKAALPATQD